MTQTRRVGFSAFLGVPSLVSLGAVIVLAVCGTISNTAILHASGDKAPLVMLAAIVLYLPVILVLISRATEARGSSTAYGIARRDAHPPSVFSAGWLSIGGYLCISALMVQAISLRVDRVLDDFLRMDVPLILLIIPVAVTAGFGELVAPSERTKSRNLLGWVAIVIYVFFLASLFLRPPMDGAAVELPAGESKHWLTGAAIAASALWFVDVLLDYRRQFQRSDKTLAGVVTGAWAGFMLLAVGTAILIVRHPDLFDRNSSIGAETTLRHQIGIAALTVTLIVCGITLLKCTASLLRIAGSMARDGLLPSALEDIETETRIPAALISVLTLATVLLAWLVRPDVLASIAAVTFLWTCCLIFGRGLLSKEERPKRGFQLPAHPVLPVLALIIAAFSSLVLPNIAIVAALVWGGIGVANYLMLRGGTRELTRVAPADLGTESMELPDPEGPRILVCLGPASRIGPLIRLGAQLARARGGDAVVLEVMSLLEQVPRGRVQTAAEEEWKALDRRVLAAVDADDPVMPLVRIAPTTEAGIIATAKSHEADLILMDWPVGDDAVRNEHKSIVEAVVGGTDRAVAIVRGSISGEAHNVVVATSGGPDADAALRFGSSLAAGEGSRLSVLCVRTPIQDEEALRERLDTVISAAEVEAEILFDVDDDPKAALVKATEEHEILIVGFSRDRAVSRSIVGSLWVDLIGSRTEPTILVRKAETVRVQWAHRLWEAAFQILPTLSVGERAEVYAQMRLSARAGVDFYVLIIISSAIATFGLFQNSAAVIIGAMLVAPLMSPIVSIAQGIVQGNLRMMRKGLSSTMKGTVVAVAVATFFTLLVPDASPTAQILARTEPTLLDLGVGLAAGAAAAYGVSRKSVAAALPGVAIAVALVPPLAVVGYGIGSNRFDIAFGSTLLYLTNLVAIILMGAVLFLLLGFYPRQEQRRQHVRGAVGLTVIGSLLLAIPLGLSSFETTRVDRLERIVEDELRLEAEAAGVHLESVTVDREDGVFVVRSTVFADRPLDGNAFNALRDEIEKDTGTDVRLITRVLRIDRFDTNEADAAEKTDGEKVPEDVPPPDEAPAEKSDPPPSGDTPPSEDGE